MSDKDFKRVLRTSCQRESSSYDELAQLVVQFRNAYTMKALEAQVAEKQAEKLANSVREKLSLELMNIEREKLNEKDQMKKLIELKKREEYKEILQEQIVSKELKKKNEIELAIVERKVLEEVDELMDKLHHLTKQKHRDFYMEKIRRERLVFEEIRAIKRAINEEKELKAIERETLYMEEIERRSQEMKIQRENKVKCREAMIEEVAKYFVNDQVEKRERDEVIADLVAEEMRYTSMIEERKKQEKKIKSSEELKSNLKSQMLMSIECELRANERDKLFMNEVMAKIMADEKSLQLTMQAKKRKQIQYKNELEKLIHDKIKIHNEILTRRINDELYERKNNENIITEKIKNERYKLIVQHAENISEYFKNFTLSDDEKNIIKQLLIKCKKIT